MIAARYLKVAGNIWILPGFYILNPCAIYAERNFIFGFACGSAGVASDASSIIDYKTIVGH